MKNRVEAFVMALLLDLSDDGDDLSVTRYVTDSTLRNHVATIIDLAKRHSTDPGEWASASSLTLEATTVDGLGAAEYKAGLAAANGAGAVWYATKGDVSVAMQRALAAADELRGAAEAAADERHGDSSAEARVQAVAEAKERAARLIANAAITALFVT